MCPYSIHIRGCNSQIKFLDPVYFMQLVFKQKNLRAQFILTEGLYRLPGPSWIVFVKNVNIL